MAYIHGSYGYNHYLIILEILFKISGVATCADFFPTRQSFLIVGGEASAS